MEYRDKTIEGEVVLDGNVFTGCTFKNCRVVYRGTAAFTLSASHFNENVQWHFDGPAGATLKFLSDLYRGPDGPAFVEQIFESIRRGL